MRLILKFILIIILTGCGTIQQTHPEKIILAQSDYLTEWRINGRISIKTPEDTNIVSIRWLQNKNDIQIRLYGSLGKTYARLVNKDGLATLTVENKTYTDPEPQHLFSTVLGWDLPIREMAYWIKGVTHPSALEQQLKRNEKGLLTSFNYKQWKVEYDKYKQFDRHQLPVKLILTHPKLRIRISIQNWLTSGNS